MTLSSIKASTQDLVTYLNGLLEVLSSSLEKDTTVIDNSILFESDIRTGIYMLDYSEIKFKNSQHCEITVEINSVVSVYAEKNFDVQLYLKVFEIIALAVSKHDIQILYTAVLYRFLEHFDKYEDFMKKKMVMDSFNFKCDASVISERNYECYLARVIFANDMDSNNKCNYICELYNMYITNNCKENFKPHMEQALKCFIANINENILKNPYADDQYIAEINNIFRSLEYVRSMTGLSILPFFDIIKMYITSIYVTTNMHINFDGNIKIYTP
ncbi:hypothetical protein HDU92_008448 [Lobulomyces angularis]|nr:hypothetical protein HDU92_008448 [Lobulomyces angularis]